MLNEKTFRFLKDLKAHNDRDWFRAHKAEFEAARDDFAAHVAALIGRVAAFDDKVRGVLAEECVFRIYRDTRFAKDKAPYKTNFAAYIAAGGRKSPNPGYYVHVEPGASFVAGGAYTPEPAALLKIRRRIAAAPAELFAVVENEEFAALFGDLGSFDAALVNVPRGFPKDHPAARYLKYKSFVATRALADDEAADAERTAATLAAIRPLNDFLRRALAA